MLSMLDRHAVHELVRAGVSLGAIARQLGVSRRTIRRIKREAPITSTALPAKRPGRPGVRGAIRERLRALVLAEPTLPPGELWRRLRDDDTPLGLSTVYRLLTEVRATLPAELLVRFEGVAGEFAQFDFGEVSVQLVDGSRRVVSVTEVTGMEGEVVTLQDLFVFDRRGLDPDGKVLGRFAATGIRPKFYEKLLSAGIRLRPDLFDEVVEV